ncbi:MAG TPA: xanthine dehydrogenase family protein subunit M [Burkholderiales bacterium]
MTEIEQYVAPSSLEQAAEYLRHSGEVTILAGGTDLMPQSQGGRLKIKRTLMNIRHIPELKGIAIDGGAIRIGSLATITEIMRSELIKQHLPVLVDACDHFASDQIRNAATLGGNVCNASPAGDMLVPLLVLDAEVELASKPNGSLTRRRLPLAEFFAGPGKTRRGPAELLAGVRIALPPANHYAHFFKFGTRPALDISTISIGIAGILKNGALSQVRVAFGAVAPVPMRAPRTEQALEGKRLDPATIDAVAEVARDEVTPIDDIRATAWYRKELIHNITKRMLAHVAQT